MTLRTIRGITLIWLAWSVILIGYMHFAHTRHAPARPDNSLVWTANETNRRSLLDKPYLLEPFLNTQVAWDSEFYLSIATVGYDDPDVRVVQANGEGYSMSSAFFPLYPYLMKIVRIPFTLFLNPIAASALAGVIVSLLGTLAALIALYSMVRDELGDEGGLRTAYMMLIFPTSFFFATIYTEGLFVGLAFSSLAFMRRGLLIPAAVLAALATWTRTVGGVLLVPLLLTWWLMYRRTKEKESLWWYLPITLLPLFAYGVWRLLYGQPFDFVQEHWFGNGPLQLKVTLDAWEQILRRAREVPETAAVVALGIGAIALALVSCVLNARRYPQLALFGFIAIMIPLTSGWTSTQSSIRYVLAVPTLWVMLGQWSHSILFDRAWTLASILLLAMQAYLFSFDFWVG